MISRVEQLEEIFEGFHALRHKVVFKKLISAPSPRITHSQWLALAVIARTNKPTIKDIHTALGITSGATTQLVNGLVSKGYVIRKINAADRRAVALELSPTAKKFFRKVEGNVIRHLAQSFSTLNNKEFAIYIKLTRKIMKQ
jgi:DNA-binding MarR family transcriptional regulator